MTNSLLVANNQFAPNIYKKIFSSLLDNLKYGCITVQDSDEVCSYGDSKHTMQARIKVYNLNFYKEIFWGGGLGLAESYVNNIWDVDNLTMLLRILTCNLEIVDTADRSLRGGIFRLISNVSHFFKKNNLTGSRKNIAKHYDLGNQFFSKFLDPSMMYSSAIYQNPTDTLAQASINKLQTICDKLELKPADHLLEIGTGWGGLAIFAAQNYGCKVTTTTISQEQFAYAAQKVSELGLQNKISVIKQDYRELAGQYDKLVSIEMIEAVGHHYFADYFIQCSKLVKPSGLFLLQAITIADQRYESARDSVDFIKKHIFPGCCIPSVTEIMSNIKQYTSFNLQHAQDITLDYARTLKDWRDAFEINIKQIIQQGFDQEFVRKWRYYFSYCEAGFLERAIFDVQLLFAKPQYRPVEYATY